MTIDLERLAVDADYWDEVAPEGATHFMHTEKFVKWVFGVEWVFYASSGREWKKTHCNWMLKQYLNDGTFVLAKPAAQEYDGTGLPPVGCECEVKGAVENWCKCEIVAHHKGRAVFFCDHWAHESDYDALPATQFRPIRSQAERVRDAAIDHAFSKLTEFKEARQVLGDLYDAGLLQMPDEDVAKNARGES
jgi:hypothetical protein